MATKKKTETKKKVVKQQEPIAGIFDDAKLDDASPARSVSATPAAINFSNIQARYISTELGQWWDFITTNDLPQAGNIIASTIIRKIIANLQELKGGGYDSVPAISIKDLNDDVVDLTNNIDTIVKTEATKLVNELLALQLGTLEDEIDAIGGKVSVLELDIADYKIVIAAQQANQDTSIAQLEESVNVNLVPAIFGSAGKEGLYEIVLGTFNSSGVSNNDGLTHDVVNNTNNISTNANNISTILNNIISTEAAAVAGSVWEKLKELEGRIAALE